MTVIELLRALKAGLESGRIKPGDLVEVKGETITELFDREGKLLCRH